MKVLNGSDNHRQNGQAEPKKLIHKKDPRWKELLFGAGTILLLLLAVYLVRHPEVFEFLKPI